MMLLEDAEDLCDFLLASGRTMAPTRWAEEIVAAVTAKEVEGLF
jgi:hypothetical protein